MEELKLLIEMVNNLPSLAVWVLVGYLVYKVVVVGSMYGLLRLIVVKAHDWATGPKKFLVGAACINDLVHEEIQRQIARLGTTNYIHMSDVDKLRKALDEVLK